MKITKKTANILLAVFIGMLLIGIASPEDGAKEAVADVEGQSCQTDIDCPCWGTINNTDITAWGVGISSCDENTLTCDTTFCVDVEPVGTWVKDNPLQWAKNNILIVFGMLGLVLLIIVWPKR